MNQVAIRGFATFCTALLLSVGASHAQTKLEKKVGALQEDTGGRCDTTAWELVFHDEFDGTALDRTKWITYYPFSSDGSDQCASCRYMGGTNSIYTDDQVTLSDGLLHLGVEATETTWYGVKKEHKASTIRSIGNAEFTYGRFEIRCKLPEGEGLWPAFWMFGGETEIDVFEFCGEQPRLLKGALHRWGKPRFSNSGKHKAKDLSTDFHIYTVEWERDGIGWFLDGRLVQYRGRFVGKRGRPLPQCDRPSGAKHTAPYFPRAEDGLNIILDLAVSEPKGFCQGPRKPEPWPEGTSFDVDYVRVYQRKP